MIANKAFRLSVTSTFIAGFLLLFTPASQAALLFTGQNIDVTYSEFGFADVTDSIVAGAGSDIAYNDGSNIGGNGGISGVMIDFELIDFTDNAVTFQIRGDGPAHSNGAYQTTGLGGSYILSLTDMGIFYDTVSIGAMSTNLIGVAMGSEITFDAKNIMFDISTLGILDASSADIATLTLNVEFVPIPAALPLMLSGLAGLALFSHRRKLK